MKVIFGFLLSSSLFLTFLESKAYAYDFFCGSTRQGVPVTMARNVERQNFPVIYWTSNNFPGNLTPRNRCEEVSRRFQAAQDNQQLKYITIGNMNGQQVMCTSDRVNGICLDLLFTLRPGSDPRNIIMRMLDSRGLLSGRAIEQSDDQRLYINFSAYLSRIPASD